MNGCLHYIRDKRGVLTRAAAASVADAVHVVALFSTATPVPAEHSHPGFAPHAHSHIKLVAARQPERTQAG